MYKKINSVVFYLMSFGMLWAQKPSKADTYYFQQQFTTAIEAYMEVLEQGKLLSKVQRRNLADAYFKVKSYERSAAIYTALLQEKDTLTPLAINDYLRSLKILGKADTIPSVISEITSFQTSALKNRLQLHLDNRKEGNNDSKLFQIRPVNSNSAFDDGSVTYYGDSIVFASTRYENPDIVGAGYYKLYKAQRLEADTLGQVFLFGKLRDDFPYHRAMPFYVPKLDRMFFGQSNTKGNNLLLDEKGRNTISIVSTNSLGNSNIQSRFLLTDYSTSFYYPFYESTSGRLYFAAELFDSYGGTDIYYVETNNGLITGAPVNLGSNVNSPANEITPFMLEGSLYFASDIYFGHGGMDMYKAEMLEDGSYNPAENLGTVFNSPKDDYGMILQKEANKAVSGYFVSNRDGGEGGDDIYRFHGKIKPGESVIHLFGTVSNFRDSSPVSKANIDIYRGVKHIGSIQTNERGYFDQVLSTGREITLKVSKAHHNIEYREITNEQIKYLPPGGLVFELHNMLDYIDSKENIIVANVAFPKFEKGQFLISDAMRPILKQLAIILDRFPAMQMRVEAHTDSRGAKATNYILSQRRAIALRTHITELGISKNRITYKGWGEEKLLNKCKDRVACSEAEHMENNRVLFVIHNAVSLGLVAEKEQE
ncbi:MAG: OmpA family protein [Flavobacteriaceae bacterium]|nr:OmpA family protein [Flavobacteriaceae bacterium]